MIACIVENSGLECGFGRVLRSHCLSSPRARSLERVSTVETPMRDALEMSILSSFYHRSSTYADNYSDIMSGAHIITQGPSI